MPGEKRFPSANPPVRAVTGAIQGQTNNATIDVIFRYARGNVRVVILYTNEARAFLCQRPFGGEIIRMQVMRDDFWRGPVLRVIPSLTRTDLSKGPRLFWEIRG